MGVNLKGHHKTRVVLSESDEYSDPPPTSSRYTPEVRRDVDFLPRKTRKDTRASSELVDLTRMLASQFFNFPCLFYQLLCFRLWKIMDVAWWVSPSCNFYYLSSAFETHIDTSNRTRDWVLQKVITASFILICFIMLIFQPSLNGGLCC